MDVITHLYLQIKSNPALWLVLTLSSYIFGQWLFRVAKFNPLFSPIIVAVVTTMCVLLLCGVPYEQYFAGAQFIHFLLGPATVALAVPIYEQRLRLAKLWLPLSIGIVVGCATAIVSVIILGWAFGLSSQTLISLIPKSVTTPIAMGVSESLGGIPELTAVLVVITGIFGSIVGRPIFRLVHLQQDHVLGVSMGLAAHGMGTSAAFQHSANAGGFAGLAMGLSGVVTAFLAPLIALPLMKALGL